MNDKQSFDASDIKWENINFSDPWADHAVIYHDPSPPQRFQKLNPFAWINYWKQKRNSLIASFDVAKGDDDTLISKATIAKDGTIHINWEHTIE